ncbi:MAG: Uncharacterised protein [Opitutia bacterium UBA7350]|nr:MAG: Uncharacterised protein [Opitutae bacterium UBA7350]
MAAADFTGNFRIVDDFGLHGDVCLCSFSGA